NDGEVIILGGYSQSPESTKEIFSAFMNNSNIESGSTLFASGPTVLSDAVLVKKTKKTKKTAYGLVFDAAYTHYKLYNSKEVVKHNI
ncbi:MAG: hypothetical protein QXX70_01825, partial [Candidatus Micrarchaeaceae archaeon]